MAFVNFYRVDNAEVPYDPAFERSMQRARIRRQPRRPRTFEEADAGILARDRYKYALITIFKCDLSQCMFNLFPMSHTKD